MVNSRLAAGHARADNRDQPFSEEPNGINGSK
jgi:hypothetical protein